MQSADALDEQARELIRIVGNDTSLDPKIRRAAKRLEPVRAVSPEAALLRLDRLYGSYVPRLPTQPPGFGYCRLVGIAEFFEHHIDPALKDDYAIPAYFERHISTSPDPAAELEAHLGPQLVVVAKHSWMVPHSTVHGLSGDQARAALRFKQSPPYAVLVFGRPNLAANHVQVRDPCGLDAIPSRILDWYRGNVPHEKIDGDIPRAALDKIEWLP